MTMDALVLEQNTHKAGYVETAQTVRLCYSLTGISTLAGVEDYTEGIYDGNPSEDFCATQRRQHEYLLDELNAGPGFRLLEIGCGLGTLLAAARKRGINATGVTISEDQWAACRAKGLSVVLSDYRELPLHLKGNFDGIIANGALEHFCQPEDALEGLQDRIYREMFRIFSSLLDPASRSQRVVTTALHFRGKPVEPFKFLKSPFLQLFDSAGLHFSILHRGYGGYYPAEGQLERCARDKFALIREVDGTQDYGFTAEDWLRKFRCALFRDFRFSAALARHFISNPIHTLWFAASFIGPASQLWQFRGAQTPVRHFRHTWQAV
ncbi:MAG: class I SAM-dependent methyltransferase [Candidatus Eremiobacteraeota bacterium]|nr:class I SAM-dependent methyltransferase [Candidatus Eremiobacteraeota bacterium]